jgi:hypothetical protein
VRRLHVQYENWAPSCLSRVKLRSGWEGKEVWKKSEENTYARGPSCTCFPRGFISHSVSPCQLNRAAQVDVVKLLRECRQGITITTVWRKYRTLAHPSGSEGCLVSRETWVQVVSGRLFIYAASYHSTITGSGCPSLLHKPARLSPPHPSLLHDPNEKLSSTGSPTT